MKSILVYIVISFYGGGDTEIGAIEFQSYTACEWAQAFFEDMDKFDDKIKAYTVCLGDVKDDNGS